ncbi:DUF1810 domain-containing protein [Litorisediminicola beolgyonensis]|uniref:DUF1810 domain-containing protein n=1 Tax=Litorisediminicola beolgyonensis TaxID=1173614 RepID=A0ABW3ZLL5_9RHOB
MVSLDDFLTAQNACWGSVTDELRAGRKETHWIWWVFPQLASLGRSPRAREYGLSGLEEARRYLAHDTLRARLTEAAELMLSHEGTPPDEVLGSVDALKLRSSMTLFEAVPGAPGVSSEVLERLYGGARCPLAQTALQT